VDRIFYNQFGKRKITKLIAMKNRRIGLVIMITLQKLLPFATLLPLDLPKIHNRRT